MSSRAEPKARREPYVTPFETSPKSFVEIEPGGKSFDRILEYRSGHSWPGQEPSPSSISRHGKSHSTELEDRPSSNSSPRESAPIHDPELPSMTRTSHDPHTEHAQVGRPLPPLTHLLAQSYDDNDFRQGGPGKGTSGGRAHRYTAVPAGRDETHERAFSRGGPTRGLFTWTWTSARESERGREKSRRAWTASSPPSSSRPAPTACPSSKRASPRGPREPCRGAPSPASRSSSCRPATRESPTCGTRSRSSGPPQTPSRPSRA